MDEVQEMYLSYLADIVGIEYDDYASYYVLRALQNFIFVPNVGMDVNRCYEARSLREDFLRTSGLDVCEALGEDCTVMELMVSLAFRMEDITAGSMYDFRSDFWFVTMLQNLGIFVGPDDSYSEEYINEVLSIFVNRDYEPDGKGGLFPLKHPKEDQRNVELWYQMNAYLNENYNVMDDEY